MGDEKDILLKVGVDASDVAKGVADVKAGVQAMDADAKQAGAGQAAVQTTAALDGQTAATDRTADATENLNDGLDISRQDLMRLASVLASVDGQMAVMVRNFIRMRGLLGVLTSPGVLSVAGPLAAIGALIAVLGVAKSAMEAAKKQFDETVAAMERLRQTGVQLQSEVAGSMAAAGQPVEATNKARAMARELEAAGLSRAAAVKTVPFLVDEKGQAKVSGEEAQQITAGVQAGILKPMEGDTPEKRQRALERARRELDRHREAVGNAQKQYQVENERLYQDAALGGITEIQQIVEKETGLPAEAARARAETIQRQIKEGLKGGTYTVVPGIEGAPEGIGMALPNEARALRAMSELLPESWLPYVPGAYTPPEQEDVLLGGIRRRAGAEGVPVATTPAQAPTAPSATQPAPVTNVTNYHGPVYTGGSGGGSARAVRAPQ